MILQKKEIKELFDKQLKLIKKLMKKEKENKETIIRKVNLRTRKL